LPVAEEHIAAVLPHLSPVVAAMVQFQQLCSERPEEVINLKPCEVVREGDVWFYYHHGHKMEHRNRDKVVVLGPKAQEILRPWLERDPESYCFVPSEASAWRYRRKNGQAAPVNTSPPRTARRKPGKKYTRFSYRNAVIRACGRAGIPCWSPRQLRHTGATRIRKEFGIEAAKAVLGHTETRITAIYAERDLDVAAKIMREIGYEGCNCA
jgi:integrase